LFCESDSPQQQGEGETSNGTGEDAAKERIITEQTSRRSGTLAKIPAEVAESHSQLDTEYSNKVFYSILFAHVCPLAAVMPTRFVCISPQWVGVSAWFFMGVEVVVSASI